MANSNLKEMLEELKIKSEAKKIEIQNDIAVKRVMIDMGKLDSPIYKNREIAKQNSAIIEAMIQSIEEFSTDDVKVRKVFGFGNQVDGVLTIIKSAMYAKATVKEEVMLLTSLDNDIIEETLDALGQTAYFHENSQEIVESQPCNVELLRELLKLVSHDMGLTDVKLNKITDTNINRMYVAAQTKAEKLRDDNLEFPADHQTNYDA